MPEPTKIPVFRTQDDTEQEEKIARAISSVLASKQFILGQQVVGFERAFEEFCGAEHCVSVASGTDALELALKSLGIGSGAQVALTANAGFYGSLAVYNVGARPLYIDVDAENLTMCPASLASLAKSHVKAILVTHLYGRMANMPAIMQVATMLGVPVIEDCAQAHSAELLGRKAGTWGTLGCFSFYPTKNLGALGDGGAVITDDESLASSLRELRQYGWQPKYTVRRTGGRNSRLDEIQAAILSVKLPILDSLNRQRQEIARQYWLALKGTEIKMSNPSGSDFVAHLLVVRHPERDRLRAHLASSNICSDVHYPIPDYAQPAYQCESESPLPVTEQACKSVVTLPCFPGLKTRELEAILESLKRFSDCQV